MKSDYDEELFCVRLGKGCVEKPYFVDDDCFDADNDGRQIHLCR